MTKAKTIQEIVTIKDLQALEVYRGVKSALPKDFLEHIQRAPNLKNWLDEGYRILKDQTKFENYEIREILVGAAIELQYNPESIRNLLPTRLKDAKKAEAGRKGGFGKMKARRLREVSRTGGLHGSSEDKSYAASVSQAVKIQKTAHEMSVGDQTFEEDLKTGPLSNKCYVRIKLEDVDKIRDIAIKAAKINGDIQIGAPKSDDYATEFKAVPLLVKS